MSSSLNRIRKNIIEAMQSANNQGTSAYDSVAEVRRVDGDTAWVHIAGGVDETPVKLTIAAKAGDMVQVRVGGGRAWITGNASAPPTDDYLANIANIIAKAANITANQALQGANTAQEKANDLAVEMAGAVLNINQVIADLQNQIDGNITSWYYSVDPAMNLPPVTLDPSTQGTGWDTDEKKNNHLGDTYTNTTNGHSWRFIKEGGVFSWLRITDSDVTEALRKAQAALDLADNKRRVFYTQPSPPYDRGDLWMQGSDGDILRCETPKVEGETYILTDWVLASKYTDDTVANAVAEDLANNYITAEEIAQNMTNSIGAIQTYTFYKYATDGTGSGFSDDPTLQYRGVYSSINNEPSAEPRDYRWEINPAWAASVAENYIEDEVYDSGFRIISPDPATYARFTALFMAFYMNDILQMRMGYDSVNEAYGVMAPEIHALGSGAGVKFDGSVDATVRGRFVWEIRDNGHFSLKRY